MRRTSNKLLQLAIILMIAGCNGNAKITGAIGDRDLATLADGLNTLDEHRIFVTSSLHTGNLGGLAGADEICQDLAEAAGLNRTYKAILSTSTVNAKDRIADLGEGVYTFDQGTKIKVVDRVADLWSGTGAGNYLLSPLKYNELGTVYAGGFTWSGTSAQGLTAMHNCKDWTSESAMDSGSNGNIGGLFGYPFHLNHRWIQESGHYSDCVRTHGKQPFFCISQ